MKAKKRSLARRIAEVALGLVVGAAIAEGAFRVRDHGAFPHLNVYVPDPVLGVRLEPGATETVSFGGNPPSHVVIGADGYRGAERPAPGGDEILVVGDSMAFGLGVEESETFAARLGQALGRPVVDAGVPTYGPPEYAHVLEEQLDRRHPKTVVYVLNFLNDLFEARRPNTERHAVWDGWAVRRENAPASYLHFPGRELLFRNSHAVFALRQWLYFHGAEGSAVVRGVPSEGNARDLVDLSGVLEAERKKAAAETDRRARLHEEETRYATLSAIDADLHVKKLAYDELKLEGETLGVYLASSASPGDIVVPQQGEEGSPLAATVKFVQDAAALRVRIEKQLRDKALADATAPGSKEILRSLEERDALEKKLRAIHAAPVEIVRASLPIVDVVLRAKALVESKGARFVLLALPMDVQVSAEEWKKYGGEATDVSSTRVLVDDVVGAVRDAGGIAVDPTPELRAAEPGAYLAGDPHPSPKGHEAIADALAKAIAHPPPPRPHGPLLALPEGRSRLPRPEEWNLLGGDYLVTGSDAAGCTTRRIREWVYVRCSQKTRGPKPVNVRVLSGGHGESIALAHDGVVTLVAPVVAGDRLEARFSWAADGSAAATSKKLVIDWTSGVVEPEAHLVNDAGPPDEPSHDDVSRLCACYEKTTGEKTCDYLNASPNPDCVATYHDDCKQLLECATGWPVRMPHCNDGEINAGAELWCHALCDEKGACEKGSCVETQGAKLCVEPASAPAIGASGSSPRAVLDAAKPATGPELLPVAKAVIDAAQKVVAGCGLRSIDPGEWFDYISFDDCTWKGGEPAAYCAAADALGTYAAGHDLAPAARTFADQAKLFADWVALAERSGTTRGTLRLFQDLANAWTAYRPEEAVAPDPPRVLKLWFEKSDDHYVDYIWSSNRVYAAHRAAGAPLKWYTGPQGPFLH